MNFNKNIQLLYLWLAGFLILLSPVISFHHHHKADECKFHYEDQCDVDENILEHLIAQHNHQNDYEHEECNSCDYNLDKLKLPDYKFQLNLFSLINNQSVDLQINQKVCWTFVSNNYAYKYKLRLSTRGPPSLFA